MKNEVADPKRPLADRKTGERALILPLIGLLLLTPPLAGIFQLDFRVLGIPFTGFYLFVVWGGLIIGAALLSRRIQKSTDWHNPEAAEPTDETGDSA